MKKILLLMVVVLLAVTGCSSKSQYVTTLQTPKSMKMGQEIPLTLQVQQNQQPATGLTISAQLEMKKMDHGTVEVTFREQGNGEYVAQAKLPMGGDWVAITTINDVVQEISFTVEGEE